MWCGCFCCLQTFPAAEVVDWIDDGETPLCPYCGIDAVLPGETDLATLWALRNRRFGRSSLGGGFGSGGMSRSVPLADKRWSGSTGRGDRSQEDG
jgi:hypothetical protein